MRRPAILVLRLVASLCFALSASTVSSFAQDGSSRSGCILDRCQDRNGPATPAPSAPRPSDPAGASSSDGGSVFRRPTAASGNFDFYVLSLSWSPGFCATGGDSKSPDQCASGSGSTFVVHGLWPQYERGFPSDCDPSARPPSRMALDAARGLYPDDGLARYEWRKHGTCTGKSAADYFADVRTARGAVTIPPEFDRIRSEERIAPADVMRAFQSANPRLRPGMLSIGCQRGVLQEVRICLSKDLRDFVPCPEVARSACRSQQINVPAVN